MVRGSRTGRPIMVVLDVLGRRWALRVLWERVAGTVMSDPSARIVEPVETREYASGSL